MILNWAPACRECWFCEHGEPWLCVHAEEVARAPYATLDDGTPVYPGLGTGAFAEETVVPAAGVVRVPDSVPMEQAAVLGCAVQTGAGAVFNTAGVRAGESVVVIGLGGVGLSALQAARAIGAGPIIGVDVSEEKTDLAALHGATDFVVPTTPAKAVRKLTGGRGADHAFDCVGLPATIRGAWSASRRGGAVTVVGVGSKTNPSSSTPLSCTGSAAPCTAAFSGQVTRMSRSRGCSGWSRRASSISPPSPPRPPTSRASTTRSPTSGTAPGRSCGCDAHQVTGRLCRP